MNDVNEIQFAASEKPKEKGKAACGCITVAFLISVLVIMFVFMHFSAEEAMHGDSRNETELEINAIARMILYFGE